MTRALRLLPDLLAICGCALLAGRFAPAAPLPAAALSAALLGLAWLRWAAPGAARRLPAAPLALLRAGATAAGAAGLFLAELPWPAVALLLLSLCPPGVSARRSSRTG